MEVQLIVKQVTSDGNLPLIKNLEKFRHFFKKLMIVQKCRHLYEKDFKII